MYLYIYILEVGCLIVAGSSYIMLTGFKPIFIAQPNASQGNQSLATEATSERYTSQSIL